jgi:hypothetical protein
MIQKDSPTRFITRYRFEKDRSRPGRSLQCVKVGGVYISRLVIESGQKIGNVYFKQTNIIFFVEVGKLYMKCIQVNTKQGKEIILSPAEGIVHLPPYVALGFKNTEKDDAVVIMFSNKALRSGDEYNYEVYASA